MRTRPALAALVVPAVLLLGCSASGGEGASDGPTTEAGATTTTEGTTTTVPEDADAALAATVDATLAASSFTIDAEARLEVASQGFGYSAKGSVDYADPVIADLVLEVDQGGRSGRVEQRTDGEKLWISAQGENLPEVPDGKTWVEGDADALREDDDLEPIGLVGVVVALRAASETESETGEELDGVATTKYTTTISYEEAVDKAGDEAEGFASALSLTSPEDPILSVTAWVGNDGILRRMELVIEEGSNPQAPTGSYDLELTDVGQDIEPPEAPDAADTLTGPEADALIQQYLA